MSKTVWRRYVVTLANNVGTFRAEIPTRAVNPREASAQAMNQIGERTPAFGTVRVVSVHEIGG